MNCNIFKIFILIQGDYLGGKDTCQGKFEINFEFEYIIRNFNFKVIQEGLYS